MPATKAETFVVVAETSQCWGKGRSLADALKNCRGAGARKGEAATVMVTSAKYEEVDVYSGIDLSVRWPDTATTMKFGTKL